MSRETDRTEDLRRELVGALVDGTGLREVMALPYADVILAHLQRAYGGQRLYIPAKERRGYPLPAIEAALRAGRSTAQVREEFSLSQRTLERLFPGGLPRPGRP